MELLTPESEPIKVDVQPARERDRESEFRLLEWLLSLRAAKTTKEAA